MILNQYVFKSNSKITYDKLLKLFHREVPNFIFDIDNIDKYKLNFEKFLMICVDYELLEEANLNPFLIIPMTDEKETKVHSYYKIDDY